VSLITEIFNIELEHADNISSYVWKLTICRSSIPPSVLLESSNLSSVSCIW